MTLLDQIIDIASIGLSSIGAAGPAAATFGVGAFFWLVIGAIVIGRLIGATPLPAGATPMLSLLLATPATGGTAWLLLHDGRIDAVAWGFAGIVAIMLLVELSLIPVFAKAPRTMSYWAFSFPVASTTSFALRWLWAAPFPGSGAIAWSILGLATSTVFAIAFVTLALPLLEHRRGRHTKATEGLTV